MKTVEVRLPDDFENQLEPQMRAAGFDDLSSYVEALLKADRRRLAQDELETELLRGLESGPASPLDEAAWERITREFERRRNERRSTGTRG